MPGGSSARTSDLLYDIRIPVDLEGDIEGGKQILDGNGDSWSEHASPSDDP